MSKRVAQKTPVALCFGSNMGDRRANINRMEDMTVHILTPPFVKSSLMETAPVEVMTYQPSYYNRVFCGYFSGSAENLLDVCQEIELSLGRENKGLKEPRTADIDILLFGEICCENERLKIPHPQIFTRWYCIEGLHEVVPEWIVPGKGLTIRDLYATMKISANQQGLLKILK